MDSKSDPPKGRHLTKAAPSRICEITKQTPYFGTSIAFPHGALGGVLMSLNLLRNNDMMARLLNALEAGKDIGHYGRFVFAMIARRFFRTKRSRRGSRSTPGSTRPGGRAGEAGPATRRQPAAARADPRMASPAGVSDLSEQRSGRLQRLPQLAVSPRECTTGFGSGSV